MELVWSRINETTHQLVLQRKLVEMIPVGVEAAKNGKNATFQKLGKGCF